MEKKVILKQQIEVMVDQLEKERRRKGVNGERFMLLCERQGIVAEMMALNEFSKNLDSANNPQEAALASEITSKLIRLSGKIMRINRKINLY